MLIINFVKDGAGRYNWKTKVPIDEIHNLLNGLFEVHVEHMYTKINDVAYNLAKVGHYVEGIKKWDDVNQTLPSTQVMVER